MANIRNQSPSLIAGGNISPSTFVKLSTSADNTGLQAGANDPPIGISGVGTKQPPGVTGSDAYHAHSGEAIELFGCGDICLLLAGSGGFTRGDRLKSDASGAGVTEASSGAIQNVGAIALESTTSGAYGRVQVLFFADIVTAASGSIVATDITGTDSSLDIAGLSPTTAGAGGAVPIVGGTGNGANNGGACTIAGGASGSGATGNGGAASVTGGAAASTNGSGGAASCIGGAATGTGTGGAATLRGGASGGASGTGGNVAVDAGAATGGTAGLVLIGDVNASFVYLGRGGKNVVVEALTVTSIGTSQSSTPTAAQLLGGIVTQTGATGAGTVTLPTGTAISAAFPRTPATGDTFQCTFANLGGGQTLTITGATGSTVVGTAAVGSGKNATLEFVCTGTNAWSVYCMVSA